MSGLATYIPLDELIHEWPDHLFSNPGLASLAITAHKLVQAAGRATAYLDLAMGNDIVITIVGCDGLELVLPTTALAVEAEYVGTFELRMGGFSAILRIRNALIKPVEGSYPEWFLREDAEGNPEPIELELEVGQLLVDADFSPSFEITNEVTLSPFMIGNTGIVVEATGIQLFLSGKQTPPPGQPVGFLGVVLDQVSIYLPTSFDLPGVTPDNILVRDLVIGHGGVSGSFSGDWQTSWEGTTPLGNGAGTLLGMPFALKSLGVALTQNALTSAVFAGEVGVLFFDTVLAVEVSLDTEGVCALALTGTDDQGMITVETPIGTLAISSLGIASDEGGTCLLVSGTFQLEVGSPALQWPEIAVENLQICADGSVKIPGGWLDLQTPLVIDLYGFRLEITRIGFGKLDDGRRRICFSGGLHLIDLLPAGVSFEGLCVTWDPTGVRDPEITLDGVGLELLIPGVIRLSGDVALLQEGGQHFFKGNASLEILPIGVKLDAALKIGHDVVADYNFVYTFLSLELPIGIPLWATGAALFGISGLYGMNVLPATEKKDWYAWYAGPPEPFNVTNSDKWRGKQDGRAFGAGMVLGTLADTGRAVSAKALFALILPGPVILFNGKANILQTLPKLSDATSEATFDLLSILDAHAGDLQMNIDAGWSLGKVIDIHAGSEAYFSFASPAKWHLYLGQDEPEDRRIRATIIALFHADSYLMLDRHGIKTGAGVNWGADWKFGPVKVILRSSIEMRAVIAWQPPQLGGSLRIAGEFEISVAGFGVGLSAEAGLAGKAPTLYWIRGDLTLRVKLPAPLKDLEEDIVLEWKEAATPPSQDPFKSTGLEHPKVDETWMLEDYNEEDDPAHPLSPGDAEFAPGPIVPLDARPSIVFDRPMKDVTANVDITSVNVYPGGTQIGDHTFDYEVQEISLEKWSKAAGTTWERVEDPYGAWMAIEDANGEPAASTLQIWAKSPFEFTRRSSRTYRDAFLTQHPTWPCADVPEPVIHCIDWEDEPLGTAYGPIFEREGLFFVLGTSDSVVERTITACDTQKALSISDGTVVWIVFPEPVQNVELCLAGSLSLAAAFSNGVLMEQTEPWPDRVVFTSAGIDSLMLTGGDNVGLARICYETVAAAKQSEATQEHIDRIVAGLTHWASEDEILEPEMWYRLTVHLETVRTYKGVEYRTAFSHYAYFQTAGPPGLTPAWALFDLDASTETASDANSLSEKPYPEGGQLTDLSPYVQWSIPANGATPAYRAYDLGVEFNENYVEQMYGADMIIQLLDANSLPIRDEEGNEVSFLNQWAEVPTVDLTETELPYVTRIEDCEELPRYSLPPNQKIIASSGILLEEDFSENLDQWTDVDEPDGDPTIRWSIAEGTLTFTGILLSGLGALLVAGEDDWTDYAVEVELSNQGDKVGLVFRYSQTEVETYHRLRLDTAGRRLERVSEGVVSLLWEDHVAYVPGEVKTLAVQCQGNRLRGQVDDELLFDLHDEGAYLSGKVGIYTNSTAAFEHFLVREWPDGVLAPQTLYTAELLASFVLFQGGLTNGWTDTNFAWNELTKDNSRIGTIGREEFWDNYRLEVNVTVITDRGHVGAIVRFSKDLDTFTCYRLLLNKTEQTLRLARLDGTYSGSTYKLDDEGRTPLWSCIGADCGIDFNLDEHHLAVTCNGPTLIIELDGQELARVEDQNPLLVGQTGLYYEGEGSPDFSEFIIRSAPRQPVYRWSFISSKYAGLVELMDTFSGLLYAEEVTDIDRQQFAELVDEALTGMEQATTDRNEESARHFEALYELLFDSLYRPVPPVVEISEIVEQQRRHALLFESPEPLDWSRLNARLSMLNKTSNRFEDIEDMLFVWNNDGTKTLLVLTDNTSLLAGEYRLHFDYRLDLGAAYPLLRRSGSTLSEVAALFFTLPETKNSQQTHVAPR